MRIETERLVIRDLEPKDEEQIVRIVWQKDTLRFMKDWSEHSKIPGTIKEYIEWHQTQKDSTDIYENKRYAITLKGEDVFIGTVVNSFSLIIPRNLFIFTSPLPHNNLPKFLHKNKR